MDRTQALDALASSQLWDVLVIGGGATGLGTALDAASRGLKTVLVEAEDFAKGTSSRSTKLIHGGVRYLRSGQVRMVRESLKERGLLFKNAPQFVHPLEFVIPTYQRGRRWFYYAGMKAYDWLAGSQLGVAPARLLSRARTLGLAPDLTDQALRGGVLYTDGQFDDSGLAIALAKTAIQNGASVANYCKVTGLLHDVDGRTAGAVVMDRLSGHDFELRAKVTINATGVFTRSVMELDSASVGKDEISVVPSRGVHLVLDAEFWRSRCAMLIPDTEDGRVLFAIPWLGKVLVGTTDQAVDSIDLEPRASASEIDYLLKHVGEYLQRKPRREDIRSVFAGLRPLVGKSDRADQTAGLSREHEIVQSSSGLISVIGGKWTTYRQMGEELVDRAMTLANLPRVSSRTASLELSQNQSIQEVLAEDASLSEQLHPRANYLKAHVVQAVRFEMACNVEDVLARRLRLLFLDARAARDAAPVTAQLMAQEVGHGADWIEQQVRQFTKLTENYLC